MRSKAWVLVMNGDKAIFLLRNQNKQLREFLCLNRQPQEDSHDSKDMMADQNRTYRHQHHAFYEEVRNTLQKYRAEGLLDSLYLVAAPKVLGDIREGLDKNTRKKVKKAIPKDVAEYNTKALADFLEGKELI
jgi:protein required for attachment to host cells